MTLPRADCRSVAVCVLALDDDSSALRATLAQCAQIPRDRLLVLSPPAPHLQQIATRAGCRWLGRLPEHLDPSRYWCQIGEALRDEFETCWVLRAGSLLPDHWQRRLALVDPDCVAVFPLSIRHPCTTAFLTVSHQPGLTLAQLDRWLNRYVSGLTWDIPVFDGQTALLRPGQLPRGAADDRELAALVRQQGGLLVASDNLLVDDRSLSPVSLPDDLPSAWRQAIQHRHPLMAVRHALTDLSKRGEAPPATVRPTRPAMLHVCHGWGGGLWHWVEDFVQTDAAEISYILKPVGDWSAFGQTLGLYAADDLQQPLQSWTLSLPIVSTTARHLEYQVMLQTIIADYGIEAILVSSLIGHSLEALRTDLPTVLVVHDFYPACPAIVATWGAPCTDCDDTRLVACLQKNPEHRYFLHEGAGHWQTLRAMFVDTLDVHPPVIVVPSASVAQRLRGLLPGLPDASMQVIPHGLPQSLLEKLQPVVPAPLEGRRPRVVVLGSLVAHKGGGILEEIMPALSKMADVYLLGCGDSGAQWHGVPNVTVHPRYERGALGGLLDQLKPDVGLLLSVVPETFSYTLSELQTAAIPPVATRIGAFVDRIEDDRTGWLVEPAGAAILARLQSLFAEPVRLCSVREHLAAAPRRSAQDMVNDYLALLPSRCGLLQRPRCPEAAGPAVRAAVVVDPEARFADVLRAFMVYVRGKVDTSPRLPDFSRQRLARFLDWLLR